MSETKNRGDRALFTHIPSQRLWVLVSGVLLTAGEFFLPLIHLSGAHSVLALKTGLSRRGVKKIGTLTPFASVTFRFRSFKHTNKSIFRTRLTGHTHGWTKIHPEGSDRFWHRPVTLDFISGGAQTPSAASRPRPKIVSSASPQLFFTVVCAKRERARR